jgi:DNA-binding NarL/FixJ family response regulator
MPEMATELTLSKDTIRWRVRGARRVLGAANLHHLVARAFDLGLILPDKGRRRFYTDGEDLGG